jgi:putative tryptophan/tyrosine transport system substrate-binding protein
MSARRVRINILAVGARLPTMVPFRAFVKAGGLISYAPNQSQVLRRCADYVDKILVVRSRATFRSSSRPSSI